MGISDLIAGFIREALADSDGVAELQRGELAQKFNCVPSQINYVISTRFSPEHGYIVESRRGGNGYIRIRRVRSDPKKLLMHAVNAVGDEIDARSASAFISNLMAGGVLTAAAARLVSAAIGRGALRPAPEEIRDALRASILKQMLINLG